MLGLPATALSAAAAFTSAGTLAPASAAALALASAGALALAFSATLALSVARPLAASGFRTLAPRAGSVSLWHMVHLLPVARISRMCFSIIAIRIRPPFASIFTVLSFQGIGFRIGFDS
jgi:hypothetical protein